MKKKLFGLAGLILAFSFFTACPGPKPTDKVEGNLEIVAGKTYESKDAKEITINLATDTFKAALADVNSILTVENSDVADITGTSFKLKEALEDKATTATFYFVGPTNNAFKNAEFTVKVKRAALNGTAEGDLEIGKIKISSTASASFLEVKDDQETITADSKNIVAFVAGKADTTGKVAKIKLVGAKLAKDADTAADDIDVSSWFGTILPAGISATRSKITTNDGSDEITVKFKAANTVAYSGNAVVVNAKVAVSSDVELTTSNELVFFITKDPADTSDDATKKPSAKVSDTNIKAAVGSALESEEITLTLDGDCLKMDVPASDLKAGLEKAVMINDGQGAKTLASCGLSVDVVAYNKGAKVVKFKLVSEKATTSVNGTLVGVIPGDILCNTYGEGQLNILNVTANANAKINIAGVTLNPNSISVVKKGDTDTATEVTLTLENDKFKTALAATDNTWISLPAGVTAKVKTAVEANAKVVTLTITNTKSDKADASDIDYTIPADLLDNGVAIKGKVSFTITE